MENKTNKHSNIFEAWASFFGEENLSRDDSISNAMLSLKHTPYLKELRTVVSELNVKGVYSLNFNRYLGCTAGISNGVLLRTLDVTAPGLGTYAKAVNVPCELGDYTSISWDGFVGVATACAEGRFAIAYNEAPQNSNSFITTLSIILNGTMPPLWLTRFVLETCGTYEEAKEVLKSQKICTNAIFTLVGVNGEGCTIERTTDQYFIREIGANTPFLAVANHWNHPQFKGVLNANKQTSVARQESLEKFLQKNKANQFNWLEEPILTPTTRFACEMDPKTGLINFLRVEDLIREEERPQMVLS